MERPKPNERWQWQETTQIGAHLPFHRTSSRVPPNSKSSSPSCTGRPFHRESSPDKSSSVAASTLSVPFVAGHFSPYLGFRGGTASYTPWPRGPNPPRQGPRDRRQKWLMDLRDGLRQRQSTESPPRLRMEDVSKEIKRVRAQMEENEQLASLMRGLRGQNLRDSQFADDNIQLRLVEVDESSEFLPLVYEPATISAYWGRRPRAVATRIVQLLSVAGGFLSQLAWDVINKKVKENEVARAIELRDIVTSLGPAYIKLGQALSIRPDILSPVAMTELQKLCDKVPSFPDDVAMALIEEELGRPWYKTYSELTTSPIAAASLGQVYKGRLKENGDLVAVKVQRPFVLETVTVDLFIIRNLGLVLRRFPQVSIDVVGLVDEWAARFFEELDYVNEGENGTRFAEMMKKDLPQAMDAVDPPDRLMFEKAGEHRRFDFPTKDDAFCYMLARSGSVVVPKTYTKYTSRKVLTTQWIDGEKLSQSTASDVGDLVNVGVICYLKQLLDTGFFHADPHPGNLIRTPDGKLAVLDFGLVTKLTDDQKYGMVEAIAHLIHRDYAAIVKDFVKLGFIPEGVNLEPLLPVLAKSNWGAGRHSFSGNPDFAIVDEAYPYIAQVLEYYGYVTFPWKDIWGKKAMLVQSGAWSKQVQVKDFVCAKSDGGSHRSVGYRALDFFHNVFDKSWIIPSSWSASNWNGARLGTRRNKTWVAFGNYVDHLEGAQRLLTDESPRLRSALRYTIYGKSGVFNAERFIDVMQAFENFITAAKSGGGEELNGNMAELGILQTQTGYVFPGFPIGTSQREQPIQTRAALAFLLSEKGNFFREFLLDEIVKGIDAVTREQLVRIIAFLGIGNAPPVFSMVPALGPIRTAALLPTITEEDRIILNNVQKILEFLTAGSSVTRSSNEHLVYRQSSVQ
ncbi:protein kinase superfamily protein [Actinidia rufa]|uniref:Protein kinase superfamily protein n=1 Tax=Actinidia rufa TaxID=165716 RepID=A0A7J0GIN0_9ERIC|nr:protein kinase superfamily protein [Actinidia rufa]